MGLPRAAPQPDRLMTSAEDPLAVAQGSMYHSRNCFGMFQEPVPVLPDRPAGRVGDGRREGRAGERDDE